MARRSPIKEVWSAYLSGATTSRVFSKVAAVSSISVNINNLCNLQCRHCCYGFSRTRAPVLEPEEWMDVVNSALGAGIRDFHICGKEPLLTPATLPLIEYLKETPETYVGLITNGTLVADQARAIAVSGLDYLDISLNGTAETDYLVRGRAAFAQTVKGISAACDELDPRKVWVSSVFHKLNVGQIDSFLDFILELGVRNVFFQPLQPLGRGATLGRILPKVRDYLAVLAALERAGERWGDKANLELLIYPTALPWLLRNSRDLADAFDRYVASGERQLHVDRPAIKIRFYLCTALWRTGQFTADGYYVGCDYPLAFPNYHEMAVGNVRDRTAAELIATGAENRKWFQALATGTDVCRGRDCYRFCHSGCLGSHQGKTPPGSADPDCVQRARTRCQKQ